MGMKRQEVDMEKKRYRKENCPRKRLSKRKSCAREFRVKTVTVRRRKHLNAAGMPSVKGGRCPQFIGEVRGNHGSRVKSAVRREEKRKPSLLCKGPREKPCLQLKQETFKNSVKGKLYAQKKRG